MKTFNSYGGLAIVAFSGTFAGCAGFFEFFSGSGAKQGTDTVAAESSKNTANSGEDDAVRDVIAYVRSAGTAEEIGSTAVKLPTQVYDSITRYQYEFPASCGGQVFRLYESLDTQILEYEYVSASGASYVIRDYATGPSPFISAGLWGAYDHTREGIGNMQIHFEDRGSGILSGTYSRGPMTGLDEPQQQELEIAYAAALHSVSACVGSNN